MVLVCKEATAQFDHRSELLLVKLSHQLILKQKKIMVNWLFIFDLIENQKLDADNLYPNRPPSCGIYPLHSLKEGENEVNAHFSLKVSSQSELYKRRKIAINIQDDSADPKS